MKFVSYNIQFGYGLDGRYDLERLANAVANADVIALQEVERHWQRTGVDDQTAILSAHLPDHHWVYGPGMDFDASYRDAGGRLVNRRRQFGTMLLSRTTIRWSRLHQLPMHATVAILNTHSRGFGGSMRFARIDISQEHTSCLRHELMHALGLANHWDEPFAHPSMPSVMAPFGSSNRSLEYSEWDELAIRTLYDPALPPGTRRQEALEMIRQHVTKTLGNLA